jgi:hypothetical protein
MASHFNLISKFTSQEKGQGDGKMGCNGGEVMIPWH